MNFDINKKVWLHRNNHYNSSLSWRLLGFYEKGFSDENGCYISVGCGSGKLKKESIEKIKNSVDKKIHLMKYIRMKYIRMNYLVKCPDIDIHYINLYLNLKKVII